jgi:proline-specific peptidase
MLGAPRGIASLVLASTSASIAEFAEECAVLRSALPPDVRDVLTRYEEAGEFEAEEYLSAVEEFYARHVCRLEEWPDSVLRTVANLDGNQVYLTMNGPNEFTTIGNLASWDRSGRLGEIRVPTLITCGRYDELGPNCAATLEAGIPDARTVVFEQSAHLRTWKSVSPTCRPSASSSEPTTVAAGPPERDQPCFTVAGGPRSGGRPSDGRGATTRTRPSSRGRGSTRDRR